MAQGGDWYYNQYEPPGERKNKFKGGMFLVIILTACWLLIKFVEYKYG